MGRSKRGLCPPPLPSGYATVPKRKFQNEAAGHSVSAQLGSTLFTRGRRLGLDAFPAGVKGPVVPIRNVVEPTEYSVRRSAEYGREAESRNADPKKMQE